MKVYHLQRKYYIMSHVTNKLKITTLLPVHLPLLQLPLLRNRSNNPPSPTLNLFLRQTLHTRMHIPLLTNSTQHRMLIFLQASKWIRYCIHNLMFAFFVDSIVIYHYMFILGQLILLLTCLYKTF